MSVNWSFGSADVSSWRDRRRPSRLTFGALSDSSSSEGAVAAAEAAAAQARAAVARAELEAAQAAAAAAAAKARRDARKAAALAAATPAEGDAAEAKETSEIVEAKTAELAAKAAKAAKRPPSSDTDLPTDQNVAVQKLNVAYPGRVNVGRAESVYNYVVGAFEKILSSVDDEGQVNRIEDFIGSIITAIYVHIVQAREQRRKELEPLLKEPNLVKKALAKLDAENFKTKKLATVFRFLKAMHEYAAVIKDSKEEDKTHIRQILEQLNIDNFQKMEVAIVHVKAASQRANVDIRQLALILGKSEPTLDKKIRDQMSQEVSILMNLLRPVVTKEWFSDTWAWNRMKNGGYERPAVHHMNVDDFVAYLKATGVIADANTMEEVKEGLLQLGGKLKLNSDKLNSIYDGILRFLPTVENTLLESVFRSKKFDDFLEDRYSGLSENEAKSVKDFLKQYVPVRMLAGDLPGAEVSMAPDNIIKHVSKLGSINTSRLHSKDDHLKHHYEPLPEAQEVKRESALTSAQRQAVALAQQGNPFVLYFWATGTGKTTAMLAETFQAMKREIKHVYAVVIRMGTAFQLMEEASKSPVAAELMTEVFGAPADRAWAFNIQRVIKFLDARKIRGRREFRTQEFRKNREGALELQRGVGPAEEPAGADADALVEDAEEFDDDEYDGEAETSEPISNEVFRGCRCMLIDVEVTDGVTRYTTSLIVGTAKYFDDWAMPQKVAPLDLLDRWYRHREKFSEARRNPNDTDEAPKASTGRSRTATTANPLTAYPEKDFGHPVNYSYEEAQQANPHFQLLFEALVNQTERIVLVDEAHTLKNNTVLKTALDEVSAADNAFMPDLPETRYKCSLALPLLSIPHGEFAKENNAVLRFLRGDFVFEDKLSLNSRGNLPDKGKGYRVVKRGQEVNSPGQGVQRVAFFTATPVGQEPEHLVNMLHAGYYLSTSHDGEAFAGIIKESTEFSTFIETNAPEIIDEGLTANLLAINPRRTKKFGSLNTKLREMLERTNCEICMDLTSTLDMPTQDFGLSVLGLGVRGIGLQDLNAPFKVQLQPPGIELHEELSKGRRSRILAPIGDYPPRHYDNSVAASKYAFEVTVITNASKSDTFTSQVLFSTIVGLLTIWDNANKTYTGDGPSPELSTYEEAVNGALTKLHATLGKGRKIHELAIGLIPDNERKTLTSKKLEPYSSKFVRLFKPVSETFTLPAIDTATFDDWRGYYDQIYDVLDAFCEDQLEFEDEEDGPDAIAATAEPEPEPQKPTRRTRGVQGASLEPAPPTAIAPRTSARPVRSTQLAAPKMTDPEEDKNDKDYSTRSSVAKVSSSVNTSYELKEVFANGYYAYADPAGGWRPVPVWFGLKKAGKGKKYDKLNLHDILLHVEMHVAAGGSVTDQMFSKVCHNQPEKVLEALVKLCYPSQSQSMTWQDFLVPLSEATRHGLHPGFKPDIIKSCTEKFDVIANQVKANECSPSAVYVKHRNIGGTDHLALVLERNGFQEFTRADLSRSKEELAQANISRYVVVDGTGDFNGSTNLQNRFKLWDGDDSYYNCKENANGKIIRCLIFLPKTAESVTLRNTLVMHYPSQEYVIQNYMQSLGRICRRSAYDGQSKPNLYGFNAEAHRLTAKSWVEGEEMNLGTPFEAPLVPGQVKEPKAAVVKDITGAKPGKRRKRADADEDDSEETDSGEDDEEEDQEGGGFVVPDGSGSDDDGGDGGDEEGGKDGDDDDGVDTANIVADGQTRNRKSKTTKPTDAASGDAIGEASGSDVDDAEDDDDVASKTKKRKHKKARIGSPYFGVPGDEARSPPKELVIVRKPVVRYITYEAVTSLTNSLAARLNPSDNTAAERKNETGDERLIRLARLRYKAYVLLNIALANQSVNKDAFQQELYPHLKTRAGSKPSKPRFTHTPLQMRILELLKPSTGLTVEQLHNTLDMPEPEPQYTPYQVKGSLEYLLSSKEVILRAFDKRTLERLPSEVYEMRTNLNADWNDNEDAAKGNQANLDRWLFIKELVINKLEKRTGESNGELFDLESFYNELLEMRSSAVEDEPISKLPKEPRWFLNWVNKVLTNLSKLHRLQVNDASEDEATKRLALVRNTDASEALGQFKAPAFKPGSKTKPAKTSAEVEEQQRLKQAKEDAARARVQKAEERAAQKADEEARLKVDAFKQLLLHTLSNVKPSGKTRWQHLGPEFEWESPFIDQTGVVYQVNRLKELQPPWVVTKDITKEKGGKTVKLTQYAFTLEGLRQGLPEDLTQKRFKLKATREDEEVTGDLNRIKINDIIDQIKLPDDESTQDKPFKFELETQYTITPKNRKGEGEDKLSLVLKERKLDDDHLFDGHYNVGVAIQLLRIIQLKKPYLPFFEQPKKPEKPLKPTSAIDDPGEGGVAPKRKAPAANAIIEDFARKVIELLPTDEFISTNEWKQRVQGSELYEEILDKVIYEPRTEISAEKIVSGKLDKVFTEVKVRAKYGHYYNTQGAGTATKYQRKGVADDRSPSPLPDEIPQPQDDEEDDEAACPDDELPDHVAVPEADADDADARVPTPVKKRKKQRTAEPKPLAEPEPPIPEVVDDAEEVAVDEETKLTEAQNELKRASKRAAKAQDAVSTAEHAETTAVQASQAAQAAWEKATQKANKSLVKQEKAKEERDQANNQVKLAMQAQDLDGLPKEVVEAFNEAVKRLKETTEAAKEATSKAKEAEELHKHAIADLKEATSTKKAAIAAAEAAAKRLSKAEATVQELVAVAAQRQAEEVARAKAAAKAERAAAKQAAQAEEAKKVAQAAAAANAARAAAEQAARREAALAAAAANAARAAAEQAARREAALAAAAAAEKAKEMAAAKTSKAKAGQPDPKDTSSSEASDTPVEGVPISGLQAQNIDGLLADLQAFTKGLTKTDSEEARWRNLRKKHGIAESSSE